MQQKVFITGISSGLGSALALECLRRGDLVRGVSRFGSGDRTPDFSRFPNFLGIERIDVGSLEAVNSLISNFKNVNWIPDLVFLNAGCMENDLDQKFDLKIFSQVYQTNLFGAVHCINELLPHFMRRRCGTFVAISSAAAYRGLTRKKIAYAGSKAALSMTFECFRLMPSIRGIHFITVHPGFLVSENSGAFRAIAIPYSRAAKVIVKAVCKKNPPEIISFPWPLVFLYRLARFIPDKVMRNVLASAEQVIKPD